MLYLNRTKTPLFFFCLHFRRIPFGPPHHLGIKITSQATDSTLLLFTHFLLSAECNTTHKREVLIQLETLSVEKQLHRVLLFLRKMRFVQV